MIVRSYLSRYQPIRATEDDELRSMMRAAWHRREIACLPVAEIADDWERQVIINVAERLYGRRKEER